MLEAGTDLTQLSLRDLHSLQMGVAGHDQALVDRLSAQILEVEGRMSEDEIYTSVEGMMTSFRRGIESVEGFQAATASAYLSKDPGTIRIHYDGKGSFPVKWWDVRYSRSTEQFHGSERQHHGEILSIKDNSGRGFSAGRGWQTGSKSPEKRASVHFTSDPKVYKEGYLPVGSHYNTRFAINEANEFLTHFLSSNQTA